MLLCTSLMLLCTYLQFCPHRLHLQVVFSQQELEWWQLLLGPMHRYLNIDGLIDRIDGLIDRWIDGQKDRWIDRQKDRWMDGQKDRWIDRHRYLFNFFSLLEQLELDRDPLYRLQNICTLFVLDSSRLRFRGLVERGTYKNEIN